MRITYDDANPDQIESSNVIARVIIHKPLSRASCAGRRRWIFLLQWLQAPSLSLDNRPRTSSHPQPDMAASTPTPLRARTVGVLPHGGVVSGGGCRVMYAREAKICDFEHSRRREEQVRGFDVLVCESCMSMLVLGCALVVYNCINAFDNICV